MVLARSITQGLIGFCIFAAATCAGGLVHADNAASWDLGDNPAATILVFDISGGQRPRTADGPLLEVDASGLASARAPTPGDARVVAQLSRSELDALLDAIVTDQQALSIDSEAIRGAVASEPRLRIADASSTSLTLNIGNSPHSISVYALPQHAGLYPEIASLQRFLAIARILQAKAAMLVNQATDRPSVQPTK